MLSCVGVAEIDEPLLIGFVNVATNGLLAPCIELLVNMSVCAPLGILT